jgi:hypothetical protein
MSVTNSRLIYSVEVLLHEANPNGETLGQTAFYKLLVELYHRLKERNIDIQLPYFWFQYGTLLENRSFMATAGIELLYFAPYKSNTRFIPTVGDYNVSPREKEIIEEEVKRLLSEYKPADYLNIRIPTRLLDDNYRRVPLLFGKTFNREFFEYFKRLGYNHLIFTNDEKKVIENYLDTLMKQYPRQEIPELFKTYLKWDDTIRMVFDLSDGSYFKLVDDFWKTYCCILRTKYYENILPEVIQKWERDFFDFTLPEYIQRLDSERERILNIYCKCQPSDSEIDSIVDKTMLISRNLVNDGR